MEALSATSLEQFWEQASRQKLRAKFALREEMKILPSLPIEALRKISLQYRYFTQSFATDIAFLVARCPEGELRSLLAGLLHEELGEGDPEKSHLVLYDRFLESIGALDPMRTREETDRAVESRVRVLLNDLQYRTVSYSPLYAIGLRGMGGECVCGIYFGVMHEQLLQHPYMVANYDSIDWRFWDIHAGHADEEHDELVRAAVARLMAHHPQGVAELAAGYQHGTEVWEEFWNTLYRTHAVGAVDAPAQVLRSSTRDARWTMDDPRA